MDDKKLIEKCLAGENSAWDVFVKRYHRLVFRCVRFKLKQLGFNFPRALSEDITQEIFMMLWETGRMANIRDLASIKGWLAIVSINFTFSFVSKKRFQNDQKTFSLNSSISNSGDDTFLSELSPDNTSFGDAHGYYAKDLSHEALELEELLKSEISKLVPKQALALKFNILEGLPQKDIAKLLKIPENTAATLIARGKSRLKKRFKTIMGTG